MTADSNSTISPSSTNGAVAIPEGSYQTFVFSAKPGYSISSVTVNGKALSKSERDEGRITLCGGFALNSTIVVKSVVTGGISKIESEWLSHSDFRALTGIPQTPGVDVSIYYKYDWYVPASDLDRIKYDVIQQKYMGWEGYVDDVVVIIVDMVILVYFKIPLPPEISPMGLLMDAIKLEMGENFWKRAKETDEGNGVHISFIQDVTTGGIYKVEFTPQ